MTKTANSNQEWTNLILKKVILPGMGMKEDGTSTEKIGLLWDEFRGHSAAIVKEFCTSLPFFSPEIIPGGLTPVAQPLDKVINKVFKAYFRDLYDLYILTAPIMPNGSPKAPSRQLLSTWVVEAWEKIPEELVKKSWTACGYPSEKDLTCSNEDAIVVFSNEEIGAMVENLCGPGIRSNFEDEDLCGPDPSFPSDEEVSSDESDISDDDSVEDVYFDTFEEVVEVVEPIATPTATVAVGVGCAAGELCGMKTTPLGSAHTCLNCRRHVHGALCGALWDERGSDCKVTVENLTEVGKKMSKSTGAVICYTCMK